MTTIGRESGKECSTNQGQIAAVSYNTMKIKNIIWRRGRDLNPRYPLRYVRFRGGSFIRLTTVFSMPSSEFTCKIVKNSFGGDSGAALRAFLGVFFRGNDGGERGI